MVADWLEQVGKEAHWLEQLTQGSQLVGEVRHIS